MAERAYKILGRIIVAAFFIVLLSIIIYKVIYVPITFDEKAAAVYYPHFGVLQLMMYTDNWPSNHILNTLCIKLDEFLFGTEPWTVRLHSVIAFVFFFAVVYLIARRFFDKWWGLFCLPFFIMFCNPFLLDFYGLARGYGLSNALMAGSVCSVLWFALSFRVRWYYVAIVLAMLAAYANFTLLIYWVAVQLLLVLILAIHYGKKPGAIKKTAAHLCITAVLALAFIALCYNPLYKMQSTNQFKYWAHDSFFKDTLLDQVDKFRYDVRYFDISSYVSAIAVIAVVLVAAINIIIKIPGNGKRILSDPLFISVMLLLLVWAVNMLQTILLGTPYLSTRTALSYYVLFGFVLMFLMRDISLRTQWFGYAVVPVSILFALHLYLTVSLTYVLEWRFDANTYTVTSYLNDYRLKHPGKDKIDLNTTWLFHPSFNFYEIIGKTPWLIVTPIHMPVDTASQTLFYYTVNDEAAQLKNYTPVMHFVDGNSVLMIRREDLLH